MNVKGQVIKYMDLTVKGYFRTYLKSYIQQYKILSLDDAKYSSDKGTRKEKTMIDSIADSKNNYEENKNITDEGYEAHLNEKNSIWSINREYLPERVDTKALGKSYLDHRDDRVYVLDGNATITNEKKEDLQLEFDIEDYEAYTILELPYIYYLGYTVTTEQNEKIQMFESDNGMLAIKLDENIESAYNC